MNWGYLLAGPWLVFGASWLVGAFRTRRTVQKETSASRFANLALQLLGFVLIFRGRAPVGTLADRILPWNFGLFVMGVALTWIGVALALWARWHLGQYWSARVTLKEDHQLIRTGPYAHLRHPIYSGIDLAALGSALAFDQWGCVLGAACIVLAHWIKAKREERLLATQFGEAFQEHCRSTGFLFPKF